MVVVGGRLWLLTGSIGIASGEGVCVGIKGRCGLWWSWGRCEMLAVGVGWEVGGVSSEAGGLYRFILTLILLTTSIISIGWLPSVYSKISNIWTRN